MAAPESIRQTAVDFAIRAQSQGLDRKQPLLQMADDITKFIEAGTVPAKEAT